MPRQAVLPRLWICRGVGGLRLGLNARARRRGRVRKNQAAARHVVDPSRRIYITEPQNPDQG